MNRSSIPSINDNNWKHLYQCVKILRLGLRSWSNIVGKQQYHVAYPSFIYHYEVDVETSSVLKSIMLILKPTLIYYVLSKKVKTCIIKKTTLKSTIIHLESTSFLNEQDDTLQVPKVLVYYVVKPLSLRFFTVWIYSCDEKVSFFFFICFLWI